MSRKNKAADAFSEMVHAGDMEIDVVAAKYKRMQTQLTTISRILDIIVGLYSKQFDDIACWEDITKHAASISTIEWVKDEVKEGGLVDERPAAVEDAILKHYAKMKESQQVRHCFLILEQLQPYKANLALLPPEMHIQYPTGYDDTFIARVPGIAFSPFKFAEMFNLKVIWADPRTTTAIKKNVMHTLSTIYDMAHRVYNICMTPDADPRKVIVSIQESLMSLKAKPEFSRMVHAFKVLDNSVGLLEKNYSTYYAKSVRAHNHSVIIEEYINDVVNTGNVPEAAKREFGRMMKLITKDVQRRAHDPKERRLIEQLGAVASHAFGGGGSADADDAKN